MQGFGEQKRSFRFKVSRSKATGPNQALVWKKEGYAGSIYSEEGSAGLKVTK